MDSTSILNVQVDSLSNVFPETRLLEQGLKSIPLSIIDNNVADYARCAAVWFYSSSKSDVFTNSHLRCSLSKTLNSYPQWCGRLSYAVPKADGTHNERYQRLRITYNSPDDIGIPFASASSSKALSEFLPDTKTRKSSLKTWDASKLPSAEFLPSTQLAPCSDPNAPNATIQVTTFACGSIAIAIQITHSLADALSLSQFAKDFSSTSRALLSSTPLPVLTPIFNPQLLDSFAAGDIDTSTPDTEIQTKARELPMHRYDWYIETPAQPRRPDVPEAFDYSVALSPSDPIPWEQWDFNAPVSHRVLHFSKAEIENISKLATSGLKSGEQISKHDALTAHIWSLILSSRDLSPGTKSYLDLTLGLRSRVTPVLTDHFLGSPILQAAIPFTTTSSSPSLSTLASTIRATTSQFTPTAISNFLHDRAFEYEPKRLWGCCLGREHVLLTTWVHSGIYDVCFEDGDSGRPLYVEAVMPDCDGLVVVLEAPGQKGASWIENGVDVSIYLEAKSMERLLGDGRLWRPE